MNPVLDSVLHECPFTFMCDMCVYVYFKPLAHEKVWMHMLSHVAASRRQKRKLHVEHIKKLFNYRANGQNQKNKSPYHKSELRADTHTTIVTLIV